MRGRKTKLLRCGCCEAFNHKEKNHVHELEKLARDAKYGKLDKHYLHPAELETLG